MTTRTPETITIRTYELFEIRWNDGGGISGYLTEEAAAETLDAYHARTERRGRILRKTWEVEIPERLLHIYRPGCAERVEVR